MNKTKSFLVAAGISLALAFTLSCSSDDGGGSTTGGGDSSSGNAGTTILCKTDDACVEMSAETCLAFGGKPVSSCETVPQSSSSSVGNGSSSSADIGGGSSSSVEGGSSSSAGGSESSSSAASDHFNPNINYGSLTDSRDQKTYRTVVIGTQTWMAENLNYDVPDNETDICYEDDLSNYCAIYGRMYSWDMVMAGSASSNANPSGVQGICQAMRNGMFL